MDVVTFGESMVLFTPREEGPLRFVGEFKRTLGGAESNVAIALSRLGHEVGWVSKLGNDEFGLYIRNLIRGEGIDTSQVVFDAELPTAVFFKERRQQSDPAIYYYRKGSAFSSIQLTDVDMNYFAKANYIHLTGITPALSNSSREVLYGIMQFAKSQGKTLVFDPNMRYKLWALEEAKKVLSDIASQSDIVLAGVEEGTLMTGETSPEKIAQALLSNKDTSLVVIKLGEEGAFYSDGKESSYVPAYKVDKIVDTAGAGDGFAAGFLSGLLRGWSYYDAAKLGNKVGSLALTVAGDIEGFPYWHQVSPKNQHEILR